ncbi:MAG: hypothetical protein FJ033_12980 [Chloroflexi bacterium]|nr:hypothetical protein [Chloroflexota bacterium]
MGPGRQLEAEYVATGKARLIWRNLAFLGDESIRGAEAAECAADQGKFWEYRHTLFERQVPQRNAGNLSVPNLKRFADEVGMDRTRFYACVDARTHRAYVAAETEAARKLGIDRTPTLQIGSQRIQGLPAYEDLRQAVERALG